jgi:predicted dienelactone hydrolase
MRLFNLAALGLTLTLAQAAQAAEPIGFKQFDIADTGGIRPLHVTLWYPAASAGPETVMGENAAFVGTAVVEDAAPASGSHPLVLLSHGFGGSWRNLNWLATELVEHGYVVAAPDHPGTTTFDRRPEEAKRLWERPRDLSRTLDRLMADPGLAGGIAPGQVAAIGHSLGGWTVMALAGARFDAIRAVKECSHQCNLLGEIGIDAQNGNAGRLAGDLGDARIGAVVSLDLGPAQGFTPESLAAIRLPVLVFAAGQEVPEIAALKSDSAYLAAHLPSATSRFTEIPDATHFSFVQLCKPGAAAIIEKESPGESFVCRDGGARDREAIHRQVADAIIAFLAQALPQQ